MILPTRYLPTRLAAVLALALAACGGDDDDSRDRPGGGVGAACTAQSSCSPDLVCHVGTCQQSEPASAACPVSALGGMPEIVAGGTIEAADPGSTCLLPKGVPDPGAVAAQVIPLGEHPVGTPLTFTLPAGSVAFSIVSQEKPGTAVDTVVLRTDTETAVLPNSVVPTLLRDPAGRVLWDDIEFPEDPEEALVYYGGFTQTTGALTIPNTPRLLDSVYTAGSLPAGTWQFTVNDFAWECTDRRYAESCGASGSASGVYDVTVIAKNGPLTSTGTMDLAIYLVTDALTSSAAPGNAGFQRFVQSLATVLGRAGICLGAVTVYDVPAWARDRYREVGIDDDPDTAGFDEGGVCGPLAQMFTLSRGGNALQLFLVDGFVSFVEDRELSIAGIDGSIPGPSAVNGTVNSGAAVGIGTTLGAGHCSTGLNLRACGADFLAYVAAHEIGHWLGLYHVTEGTGGLFDPFTDTAACACDVCAPESERASCDTGGTSMWADYCDGEGEPKTCGGSDNLMFWLVDQDLSVGNLSRQQAQTVRLNPAIR